MMTRCFSSCLTFEYLCFRDKMLWGRISWRTNFAWGQSNCVKVFNYWACSSVFNRLDKVTNWKAHLMHLTLIGVASNLNTILSLTEINICKLWLTQGKSLLSMCYKNPGIAKNLREGQNHANIFCKISFVPGLVWRKNTFTESCCNARILRCGEGGVQSQSWQCQDLEKPAGHDPP